MARVLVGITGGIAAYKTCELIRLLVRAGHAVTPLVTPATERFVRAETFSALARRSPGDDPYLHLTRADLLVVSPLTANTLAKLATGIADNVVAEAALAHRGPLLLAPAMNPRMWTHPATQANLEIVRSRGAEIIGPDEGETAEGEWGIGRMAEPHEIFRRCRELIEETDSLVGRRVLVTAGGTQEPLDAVRFLGNRSSGRMGVALALEARKRGAEVTLLAANLAVAVPSGITVVETPTAESMLEAALVHADVDVVFMAAAVADYRPVERIDGKRTKDDAAWQISLEPTTDILRELAARRNNDQVLVGFSAEHGEHGLSRAREKLEGKRVDLVVYNDVAQGDIGFDSLDNEVVLVTDREERRVAKAPKDRIAAAVLDTAEELLGDRAG